MWKPVLVAVDANEVFDRKGDPGFLVRLELRKIDHEIGRQHGLRKEIGVATVLVLLGGRSGIVIGAAEAVAVDAQDDPTADVGRQTQLLRTAKAVTRSTCVHYRRENKKVWQLKFIMLRNNQLHWFDPPDPDTKKISSEDAVILTEPFAVQGAPQHAPPGHCLSIVTLTDRYLFIGLTPAETDEWRRLLQLIWHCARIDAGEQTGIDPQQLDAAVSQCAQEQVHQEPPLQCMQWRAGRGKKGSKESAWELVVVSVQGSEMQLSEPAGPGYPNAT